MVFKSSGPGWECPLGKTVCEPSCRFCIGTSYMDCKYYDSVWLRTQLEAAEKENERLLDQQGLVLSEDAEFYRRYKKSESQLSEAMEMLREIQKEYIGRSANEQDILEGRMEPCSIREEIAVKIAKLLERGE